MCAVVIWGEWWAVEILIEHTFNIDSEDVVVSASVVEVGGGGVIKSLFESSVGSCKGRDDDSGHFCQFRQLRACTFRPQSSPSTELCEEARNLRKTMDAREHEANNDSWYDLVHCHVKDFDLLIYIRWTSLTFRSLPTTNLICLPFSPPKMPFRKTSV